MPVRPKKITLLYEVGPQSVIQRANSTKLLFEHMRSLGYMVSLHVAFVLQVM